MCKLILFVLLSCWTAVNFAAAAVYTEDQKTILLTSTQTQFVLKLKSNPTTGYTWFLKGYNKSFLQPIKHIFITPADKKLIGAPGYELWTFRVKAAAFVVPVRTVIQFTYMRPWEKESGRQEKFTVVTRQ